VIRWERHPLGFRRLHIDLGPYALRLHLSPPDTEPGTDRHDHQYGFVSVPLWGCFHDTRYVEVPGDTYTKAVCHTGTAAAPRRLEESPARAGLRVVGRHVRWPLRPYYCRSSAVHWHRPAGRGWHASLVFVGRVREEPSRVYRIQDRGTSGAHDLENMGEYEGTSGM